MTESKGRPTPKRSEAGKRRGGPVAPPPANRKEAAARLRSQQADGRKVLKNAGADALLPRDIGPVRALVRDIVDARRSLGPLLLPVAIALPLANATHARGFISIVTAVWITTIGVVALDTLLAGRAISRAVRAQFPDETKVRSHVSYGLLRGTSIKRLRRPKPRV